ncbi:bifunctional oligoribonuclease/PAP phosphatase NrnA [Antarcticibacterium flavum]|uniref:Bifunctional oligoribonuclease/PAP phosphatase NrnA n=1 Tax=Antarcticibacterium flavum TaxID=2058175 RepID=A0A5B7X762_9FLAO|nr:MULTISPECIES: bifunctional oligoribonuclease/PAP phosphatase NrnA [Antarcticibacterium]MCM4159328.1 DHH family phosphoesterase [Antarcticibacterium sp. W02-3]QCY70965.1 bifunctional oligoribonuclease/PAP phosphatase NrnA [Antarcticibacterium flavum]
MIEQSILEITSALSQSNRIVIVPHKGPDGDAIGSSLGLYHFLKEKGHETTVIAPNDFPQFLKWLPGSEEIQIYEGNKEACDRLIQDADIIFTLDFNMLERAGDMVEPLSQAEATFIMIDHHPEPSDYADHTYSDASLSSTCQMVYKFLQKLRALKYITPEIATCLYTGIMTDTGSFRYRATTGDTHRVIADLIDKGADNNTIHSNVFDSFSKNRIQLLGVALQNLHVNKDLRTAYITLSQEELDRYNFQKGDTEGFVNYGLAIEGIIFAVIFIEHKADGMIKMSLRSKGNFSVNKFARAHFNGGGHLNAAGGRSELSMEDTITKFNTILPQYKEELSL